MMFSRLTVSRKINVILAGCAFPPCLPKYRIWTVKNSVARQVSTSPKNGKGSPDFAAAPLAPEASPVETYLLDKHFRRKHGKDAYYGQT